MADCRSVQSRILDRQETALDRAHIDGCAECSRVASVVSQVRAPTLPGVAGTPHPYGNRPTSDYELPPEPAPPAEADPLLGRVVRDYRIVRRLGAGGFGAVYYAEHVEIGRRAAIKVLHPRYAADADIVRRFFNEARAANAIRHPGIVDIYDYGQVPDIGAYLVMEYLEGESLARRLDREGPLPAARVVRLASRVASALGAAHKSKIIHRDLKPDNIYLLEDPDHPDDERVKILDFGIAKLSATLSRDSTRTNALMGTPAYMSPEQCDGAKHVDHRTDVYALGVIAYEMACGRPPFIGGVGKVLSLHQTSPPPPPRSINIAVPAALEAVLLRALEKEPEARYQTMAELATALRGAAGTRDDPSQPVVLLSGAHPVPAPAPAPAAVPAAVRAAAAGPSPGLAAAAVPAPGAAAGVTTLSSTTGESSAGRRSTLRLRVLGLAAAAAFLTGAVIAAPYLFEDDDSRETEERGGTTHEPDDRHRATAEPPATGKLLATAKPPATTKPPATATPPGGESKRTAAPELLVPDGSRAATTAAAGLLSAPTSWGGKIHVGKASLRVSISLDLTGAATGTLGKLTRVETFIDSLEVPLGKRDCSLRYEADVVGAVEGDTVTFTTKLPKPRSDCLDSARTLAGRKLGAKCTVSGKALDCGGDYPTRLARTR